MGLYQIDIGNRDRAKADSQLKAFLALPDVPQQLKELVRPMLTH